MEMPKPASTLELVPMKEASAPCSSCNAMPTRLLVCLYSERMRTDVDGALSALL